MSILRFAVVIGSLHIILLSMVCGLHHPGYFLTAIVSGSLIWSMVFLLSGRKFQAGVVAGIVAGLAVQQAAYSVWKPLMPGFWWPLAQFGAIQLIAAFLIKRNEL